LKPHAFKKAKGLSPPTVLLRFARQDLRKTKTPGGALREKYEQSNVENGLFNRVELRGINTDFAPPALGGIFIF